MLYLGMADHGGALVDPPTVYFRRLAASPHLILKETRYRVFRLESNGWYGKFSALSYEKE